jgi:hypothetical protein
MTQPEAYLMRTTHTLSRLLAATLAIGALSVPAASARPIDLDSPVGDSVTADLRSADARQAASPHTRSELGGSQRVQDLRHLEAGNGATTGVSDAATAARGEAQARYYASYGHPQTIHRVVSADDGTPWLTIGGSLAGVCLVLAGSGAIASRRLRSQARAPRIAI